MLPITKHTKASLRDFPGAEKAKGVLAYGYYDRQAGFALVVLAAAKVKGENARFENTSENTRSFIRIGTVAENEFLFFDDVKVYLVKEGLKPEGCWIKIIGLGDHFILGTLLNEPEQNFGYREGEKIAFFVQMGRFLEKQPAELTGYEEQLVRRLVESVTVSGKRLIIRFRSGIQTEVCL